MAGPRAMRRPSFGDLAAGRAIGRFGTQRVGAVGVLLMGLGCALFGSLLASMGATAGLRTASVIAAGLILVVAALNFAAR